MGFLDAFNKLGDLAHEMLEMTPERRTARAEAVRVAEEQRKYNDRIAKSTDRELLERIVRTLDEHESLLNRIYSSMPD